MLRHARFTLLAMATAGMPAAGLAAEPLQVAADQSRLVKLPALPSTVVVGNPAIADVTVDGQMLFVHARGPGLTNIIVLGPNGTMIADYRIHVFHDDPESLAVYSPAGRDTYSCVQGCEPVLRIGDDTAFFKSTAEQLRVKSELAAAQALGDQAAGAPSEEGSTASQ